MSTFIEIKHTVADCMYSYTREVIIQSSTEMGKRPKKRREALLSLKWSRFLTQKIHLKINQL